MGTLAAGTEGSAASVDAAHELAAFCRREHPRLVGAVGLYLGDVALAEEIAQEALLRACRDWSRVRTFGSPGAWVHRVAMNLAVSAGRRRQAKRRADERLVSYAGLAPGEEDREAAVAMRAALAKLPDRQREALVLRYFADLSVSETAEAMRCPEGTVKTLTSRGVATLRAMGWEVEE